MSEITKKYERRERRIKRVRKKIFGTPERPRLAVTRTNKHIYVQVVNDIEGKTLIGVSSLSKGIRDRIKGPGKNKENALIVADYVAALCKQKGIKKVVFDRRGRKYHGVLKAFADRLRELGLEF